VELVVPLERPEWRQVQVVRPSRLPLRALGDGLAVMLGSWAIDVELLAGSRPPGGMPPRQRGVFRSLDTDKNGFLDAKELYQPPFTYVSWLRLADRDGDGKLSEKEFSAFADLQGKLRGGVTFLRVVDEGQSLFRLLDADRDGRLGPRELRSAWSRLSRRIPGQKGVVTRAMLPRHFRLTLRQGQAFAEPAGFPMPSPPRIPTRGPLWFRKMDRNGDGDVSRREWLGTEEEFRKIDRDGDGLISAAEAEAYDRRFRGSRR
jgi:Ca2+-binding EF-hand superfamily protein